MDNRQRERKRTLGMSEKEIEIEGKIRKIKRIIKANRKIKNEQLNGTKRYTKHKMEKRKEVIN